MFKTLMDVKKEIRSALIELDGPNTTAEIVADRLTDGGYKGFQQDGTECPVANYLKGNLILPDDVVFSVNGDTVDIWRYGRHFYSRDTEINLETPVSISEFVSRFDRGDFEWLDASDYEEDDYEDDDNGEPVYDA